MAQLSLPFGVFVSTDEDLDLKYRVLDDTARDALITNQLIKIGHTIYHIADNKKYMLYQYPTVGNLTGVIWSEIAVGAIDIPIIDNFTPSSSQEYPDVTGIVSGIWAITGLVTEPYVFTTGDLINQDVYNGNALSWNGVSWTIIEDTQVSTDLFGDYYINNITDFNNAYNELQASNFSGGNFYITGNVILNQDIVLDLKKSIKIIGLGGKITFLNTYYSTTNTNPYTVFKFILKVYSAYGFTFEFENIALYGSNGNYYHDMRNRNSQTIIQVGETGDLGGTKTYKIKFKDVSFADIVGGTLYTGVRDGVIKYVARFPWNVGLTFDKCIYWSHVGHSLPYDDESLLPFGIYHTQVNTETSVQYITVTNQRKHGEIIDDTGFDYEFLGDDFNNNVQYPTFLGDETAQCRSHSINPEVRKSNHLLALPESQYATEDDYIFLNEAKDNLDPSVVNGVKNNIKKIKLKHLPISSTFVPKTAFISKTGDDSTGELENSKLPFLTFQAAFDAIHDYLGNPTQFGGWTIKYIKSNSDTTDGIVENDIDFTVNGTVNAYITIDIPYFTRITSDSNNDTPLFNCSGLLTVTGKGWFTRSGSPSTTNSYMFINVLFKGFNYIESLSLKGLKNATFDLDSKYPFGYHEFKIKISNGTGIDGFFGNLDGVEIETLNGIGIYNQIGTVSNCKVISTGNYAIKYLKANVDSCYLESNGVDTLWINGDSSNKSRVTNCKIITNNNKSNIQSSLPSQSGVKFINCDFINNYDNIDAVNIDDYAMQEYKFENCNFKIVPNDAEDRANVKSGFVYFQFKSCMFNVSANQVTDADTIHRTYKFSGNPEIGDVLKYLYRPYQGLLGWEDSWEYTVQDDGTGNPEILETIVDNIVAIINNKTSSEYLSKFTASKYFDGTFYYIVFELKYVGYISVHAPDHTLQSGSTVSIAPSSWYKNGVVNNNLTVNILDVDNLNKNIQINKYVLQHLLDRDGANIEP